MFAVNKELLPVKLHFFFMASVAGMMFSNPPFFRQKGIPPEVVGVIWSLLPIFSIIATMVVTNLADRFNIHRRFFLTLLIIVLAAEAAIGFGPDIIKNDEAMQLKYMNMSCQNGDFIYISNSNQLDGFHCESDLNTSQNYSSSFKCSVDQNVNSKLNGEILTHIENAFYDASSDSINAQGVIEGIHLINQSDHLLCQENLTVTCVYKCSSLGNDVKLENSPMFEIIKYPSFWSLVIALIMLECCSTIAGTFINMATLQILGEDSHKFGLQVVWATISFGIMALVYGAAIDYFSEAGHIRNYSAGYSISMFLWVFAFISAVYIKFEDKKEKEKETGSIFDVLNSFKVMIFMASILVIGISLGCVRTFQFLMMEDVANAWEPGFANLNLLQGLTLSIGCFAGEVPSMFLSGAVIELLGNVHTFTLVLAIMSTRFIVYAFIKNPWLFIPVEILGGICYGLLIPAYIAYVNEIAPPGRYATMQGLVLSVFNAGASLGALIGGVGFKLLGGTQMFLYLGLADGLFMVIYVICHMLLDRKISNSGDNVKEDLDCQTKL